MTVSSTRKLRAAGYAGATPGFDIPVIASVSTAQHSSSHHHRSLLLKFPTQVCWRYSKSIRCRTLCRHISNEDGHHIRNSWGPCQQQVWKASRAWLLFESYLVHVSNTTQWRLSFHPLTCSTASYFLAYLYPTFPSTTELLHAVPLKGYRHISSS